VAVIWVAVSFTGSETELRERRSRYGCCLGSVEDNLVEVAIVALVDGS